ncbi:uncharacterized membrane protein YhaH (DUF805 family) [Porphyrobacter sp. MBR-155]
MRWMILPFKRYADFHGRSRRMEYWMFQLLNSVVTLVLITPFIYTIVSVTMALPDDPNILAAAYLEITTDWMSLPMICLALLGLYILASFIPLLAVTVRRMHDRNMSGWLYLVAGLVPLMLPGTVGPNRYGPDPKDSYGGYVFA